MGFSERLRIVSYISSIRSNRYHLESLYHRSQIVNDLASMYR